MKKSKSILLALMFMLTSFASMASDTKLTKENIENKSDKEVRARVEQLLDRVEQIRELDRSNMDQFERSQMKDELVDIKKELKVAKTNGSTVTISVGAAIIIILLLIIIL